MLRRGPDVVEVATAAGCWMVAVVSEAGVRGVAEMSLAFGGEIRTNMK